MTHREQALAEVLLGEHLIPPLAHLTMLGLITILARPAVPMMFVLLWSAAIIVVVLARALWTVWARRAGLSLGTIRRMTRALVTVLGLTWGVGTALVAPYLPLNILSIIVMALAGLLAGALSTLVADDWSFPLYAAALFSPILVMEARLWTDSDHVVQVLLIMLFLVFMVVQHRRAHAALMGRLDAEDSRITLLRELQASLAEVKVLRGILPICSSCKRIRSDGGKWEAVESYVRDHTNAEFTHGLCPDCAARDWGSHEPG